MIWFFLISLSIITGLILIGPFLKAGETQPARGRISLFLVAFLISSLGIYSLIARPELTRPQALTPYQIERGPSAADVKAAQSLSSDERAVMINDMVDQLAERLKDNPDNPQGWIRLLRARTVLGQTDQKAEDIKTIKSVFADRPNIEAQILSTDQPR